MTALGGGRVALEKAGIPVEKYYASEIDRQAMQIARYNYPDIIHIGNVKHVNFKDYAGKIDLLIGGSPCQDLSIAKKGREGLKGDRSSLFYKFVEALEIISPKYFLLENVASMSKEDKDEITSLLGVEPILINSSLVSAQQRKRLYWCNWKLSHPQDKGIVLKDILENNNDVKYLASQNIKEKYIFKHLTLGDEKSSCITAGSHKGIGSDRMITSPIRIGEVGSISQGNRVYSVKGKTISLSAMGGGLGAKTGLYKIDLPDGDYVIRKLTPLECERLQTLPDNYTAKGRECFKVYDISDSARYKAIGNGWTIDVIVHLLRGLFYGK